MEKIVFATKNEGKMVELRKILADLPVQVVSEKEAGLDVDVVEDGATFEENALKKARAVMEQSGRLTLADDSGLEIDYLDKQPGVNSARFMGEKTSYTIKNQYFIDQLAGVPLEQRTRRSQSDPLPPSTARSKIVIFRGFRSTSWPFRASS